MQLNRLMNNMLKLKVSISLLVISLFLIVVPKAHAQMMQRLFGTPQATPTQQDLQDIQTGQNLYTKFQNKEVSCSNLQDTDFEKIGEYTMNLQFSDTNSHIQMNNRAKQMMGDQGEERMHIAIGRSVTNCDTTNQQGGVKNMMGNWGWAGSMMGWAGFGGFNLFTFLFCMVVFIDLVLLGFYLWKQINKK